MSKREKKEEEQRPNFFNEENYQEKTNMVEKCFEANLTKLSPDQ